MNHTLSLVIASPTKEAQCASRVVARQLFVAWDKEGEMSRRLSGEAIHLTSDGSAGSPRRYAPRDDRWGVHSFFSRKAGLGASLPRLAMTAESVIRSGQGDALAATAGADLISV